MAGPDNDKQTNPARAPDLGAIPTLGQDDTGRPQQAARLSPGQIFAGRYAIETLVGEGAAGSVYKAQDKSTGQTIALKLIRADRMVSAEAKQRLLREALTTRNIRHPNIVAVYDASESDGLPYMTMEYLVGRSLRSWMRDQLQKGAQGILPFAIGIIGGILNGLQAAHAQGVIHRDLKPENVFLLSDPEIGKPAQLKLLDFGIALAGASEAASTGSAAGTPHYMAPEQITAPDQVDASADLYSVSVIFYELLVGVLPVGAYWQPPSRNRPDISEAFDRLIEAGLSPNRRMRPQSVAEYIDAIRAAVKLPASAAAEQPAPTAPPAARAQPDMDPAEKAARAELLLFRANSLLEVAGNDKFLLSEAFNEFKLAAEAGNYAAMAAVWIFLLGGSGVPADHDEADRWFKRIPNPTAEPVQAQLRKFDEIRNRGQRLFNFNWGGKKKR